WFLFSGRALEGRQDRPRTTRTSRTRSELLLDLIQELHALAVLTFRHVAREIAVELGGAEEEARAAGLAQEELGDLLHLAVPAVGLLQHHRQLANGGLDLTR